MPYVLLQGHNKWSKVKHVKGAKDAKKSLLYSKISLEIVSAAKTGGPDPLLNNRLAAALNRAKAASMPKDSIENALKKVNTIESCCLGSSSVYYRQ